MHWHLSPLTAGTRSLRHRGAKGRARAGPKGAGFTLFITAAEIAWMRSAHCARRRRPVARASQPLAGGARPSPPHNPGPSASLRPPQPEPAAASGALLAATVTPRPGKQGLWRACCRAELELDSEAAQLGPGASTSTRSEKQLAHLGCPPQASLLPALAVAGASPSPGRGQGQGRPRWQPACSACQ